MSGWLLSEERSTISSSDQDFEFRAFVGPPRDQVIQASLQQDSPLDVSGVTKLTADFSGIATTATVESTLGFPENGGFFISTEFVLYATKTDTTFTDLTRQDPQDHDADDIVKQFSDVTDRVLSVSLNGSIDQHEWVATIDGDTYDHRLFQPDRSVYIETRYFPSFGHEGPITGDGFTSIDGFASEALFALKDEDGNSVEPRGMDWASDGNLWVCTNDDLILKVNPESGEVLTQLTHSLTNLEGLVSGKGNSLWVAHQDLVIASTIYQVDIATGNTISSFDVNFQPSGLATDGAYLYMVALDTLNLYKYDTEGVLQWAVSGPDEVPGGVAYWDGDLWVIGANSQRLYRVDRNNGIVYSSNETNLVDPQALAIGPLGARMGSANTDTIYKVSIGAREGTQSGQNALALTLKFTLGANIVGASWGPDGTLWVALDSDVIANVNPGDGTVISSFSSPVSGLTAIAHDGATSVWVGSSSGTPKKLWRIALGVNEVTASFEIPGTAQGLDYDGRLWFVNELGAIYKYDLDGSVAQTWDRDWLDAPRTLALFDNLMWIVNGDVLYALDDLFGVSLRIMDIPDELGDAQGLAMSALHGHRIGDGADAKVYDMGFTTVTDEVEGTGGWSSWLPFYFGYIESGSIRADYLEKTWSLRCRSTWMYFGDKEAAGRNLAPTNIARFRPVTCSSVLADPAVEIGNEYISVPGEGVACSNIVDDDATTLWISQDLPHMDEGKDPIPLPVYGCPNNALAESSLRQAASAGADRILLNTSPSTNSIEHMPADSWIVIDKGSGNEEFIHYTIRIDRKGDFPPATPNPDEAYVTGFLNTNGAPTTLQVNHLGGETVSGRGVDICGIVAPDVTKTGETCFGSVPYSRNQRTGNSAGTGIQFPLLPGDSTDANGQLARRMVFTEIHKPRLGLRPELSWWAELRNMSDTGHANIPGNDNVRGFGQGFVVLKWLNLEGESKSVNIPLCRLVNGHTTIGPWALQAFGDFTSNPNPCQKGWLIICGDRTEFNRWWTVPFGVPIVELRFVTDEYDGSRNPPTSGKPVFMDFVHGEIKFYWYNQTWEHMFPEDTVGTHRGKLIDHDISSTDTEIQVRNIDFYPDYGWGWIYTPSDNNNNYEWVSWSGRRTTSLPFPSGGGFSVGVLENVTRGYEGTVARFWPGQVPDTDPGALPWKAQQDTARVILAHGLPPQAGASLYGNGNFKLSDWVKFDGEIDGYQSVMPTVKHGNSYARLPEDNWKWIHKKVPQPGERLRTQRPEWFSVDLGEVTPPLLYSSMDDSSSTVLVSGDISRLTSTGVVLIDQEFIHYNSINRETSAIAPQITAELSGLTRGYDGSSTAAHPSDTQIWQVFERRALTEHLVSGVSWQRKSDAPDGIPTHYRIYTTWRPSPRRPNQDGWENDWDLIWLVSGNTQKSRAHFIQEFSDLDGGADSSAPPSVLGFHAARHVMMVIDQVDSGRAKINEFKVFSTNPRTNLLSGSMDTDAGSDADLSQIQNTVAVFFDYVIRGFGMKRDEVIVIGTGVNFAELPVSGGTFQSILSELADRTGYRIWFNRFNQLWFVPDPATRRSMPVMTNLDDTLMRGPIEIVSQPSGRVNQVTVFFRDDLADETIEVRYPEQPIGLGNALSFDGVVVASAEEAKEIARQKFLDANGQWEIVAKFGIGHHFIMGHRYTVTYADWEGSDTYFQGQNFYIAGMTMTITTGPERRWDTNLTLQEYHAAV